MRISEYAGLLGANRNVICSCICNWNCYQYSLQMEKKPQRQQFNKTKIVAQKTSRSFGSLTWFSSAFARYQYWHRCYITFNIRRESIIRVDMRQPCVFTLFYFFDIFFLWKNACLFFSVQIVQIDPPHLCAPLQNSQVVYQDSLCLLTASWETKMEKTVVPRVVQVVLFG